jgi:hypothetical protein
MMTHEILIQCPHCNSYVVIFQNEINCAIFRHAIRKDTYQQIDPHTSQDECERLLSENAVFGCAKPFKLVKNNNCDKYTAEQCEFI